MIYYLIIINVIGFFIMSLDKKKAIKKAYRIPEKNLLFVCVLGGSLGMLIGMYKFHHKTKHNKFVYGVPSLLIFNIIMIYSMMKML
ncbi:MAG: DUF1294 domain-containing protein [Terrisporobacter othiniensis]|uniref:DUF1294 domain-containing protein n=1 Tax=Terrisporobacter petrolearius TaxID=1460447 RepID=UPI001A902871|nr:DUF1294 domain-containing protein [Terrisporobacter petrolearius]MBN9646315.1 DUF1294 domain-containing protein [Terrisporobacter glycolicus]MDU4859736.1 DUF1294 domain-containing protein [Terrisporobacter othiniensis]MDU6994095.1 DUF1294 domain-containing protein [Terrisporobacter othiniensis]